MLYQGIIGGGSSPVEPVDLSPVLLWTNSNPGAAFAAQTVSLDLTEYAGVIIEFNHANNVQYVSSRIYVMKSDDFTHQMGAGFGTDSGYSRNVTINNTGVTFNNASAGGNHVLIPVKIYGVKEYVVEPVTPVGDLLWTNPNPTSGLAKTELSGDYSKYKSLVVKAKLKADNDFAGEFNIYKNNLSTYGSGIFFVNVGVESYYRNILLSDEKITIDVGWITSSNTSIDGVSAIPLEIYGIE